MFDAVPTAQLVYDGKFYLPVECGEPRLEGDNDDQLQGTMREMLCELSGRECYDSLGKGRGSIDYHAHIAQVGHLSVYEHANFTITLPTVFAPHLLNRPGIYAKSTAASMMRVTLNLRSVLDWGKWEGWSGEGRALVQRRVLWAAKQVAPMVFANVQVDESAAHLVDIVEPHYSEEKWISLRLTGSRGLTHEQVRHGDRTAISQRSTRYVDESEGAWVLHPLIHQYFSLPVDDVSRALKRNTLEFIDSSRSAYAGWVEILMEMLEEKGVSKHTARKQARGAARGLLGNALGSSMIFSASVAQCCESVIRSATDRPSTSRTSLSVRWFSPLKRVRS